MPMQYDFKYVVYNVCQGLELICIVQCFVEWFAISGEEMLGVDNYHILYYSRGIEGGQPLYQMYADCRKIFALHSSYWHHILVYSVLLCWPPFFSDLLSVVHFQCWLSFWYRQSLFQYNVSLRHRWPWPILVILFSPFGFIAPNNFSYWLSNLSILNVPDEGYSRNASCILNLISTFLLLHLPL